MIRATEVIPAGRWPPATASDRLVLSYDERHRRRLRYVAVNGTTFLLDLPRAVVLRAGDGLKLEDGRIIGIDAAPEELVEVTAPDTATLVRLAWHIGNRHLPAQLEPQRIFIRDDAVIVHMLKGLGATVKPVHAPFTPEAGAYDNTNIVAAGHSHDRIQGHDPEHGHTHEHGHAHHHHDPRHDHD